MKKIVTVVATSLLVSGCLLPFPVQIALLAADGISLFATEKTLPDHAISVAMDQDCAMWRILPEGRICSIDEADTGVAVADASIEDEGEEPDPNDPALAMDTAAGDPNAHAVVDEEPPPLEVFPIFMTKTGVIVRDGPSTDSLLLDSLWVDEPVALVEKEQGWWLVEYIESGTGRVRQGWIGGEHLREDS